MLYYFRGKKKHFSAISQWYKYKTNLSWLEVAGMIDDFTLPLKPAEGLTPIAGEESELYHWNYSHSHATSKQWNKPINHLHIHCSYHTILLSCSAIKSNSRETNHSISHLAILSLQDMVSSLSPCNTPSHVWIVVVERTGMVPSPDSIFVRSCPLALRFGCRSPWSKWQKLLTISWEAFSKCFTDSITIRRVDYRYLSA